MTEDVQVPPRVEIPEEDKWDPSSVFASRAAWESACVGIGKLANELKEFRGRLGEAPSVLVDALLQRDDLIQLAEQVYVYAGLHHMPDIGDGDAAAMFGRAVSLYADVQAAASFFEPELLAIGDEKLEVWMEESAELAVYRHYFEDLLRRAEHVRSDEVEELLGMLAEPFNGPQSTMNQLTNADFKFEPALTTGGEKRTLTQGSLRRLLARPDRNLRRTAWDHYNVVYEHHKNALANNLLSSMKQDLFLARARRYPNTLDASLFVDGIPRAVYESLIDEFTDQLPTWHRYFALRKQALGVDELHPYDIWAPLAEEPLDVPFEQAVEWICQGLQPMGEDYVEAVRRGCLQDRWVDAYPNQGKRDGAFSFGTKGTHPFIQMNYVGTMGSVSILAHELGHSMHSYLTWREQPMAYADYSLFVAETASNFHQALVRHYLLETAQEKHFKIAVIEEAMINFHRYLLIMPTLSRFELEIHERLERGEGVNTDDMIELCLDLFGQAYGEAMAVNRDELGMWWAQFGHLYRNYYVFQYATGISTAHALAEQVLSGDPAAVERYRACLRAGGSLYPAEALRLAGVDPTKPDSVRAGFRRLSDYVDTLEELLG
ncbi:MAG: oligoendopeptidase F [Anaerolineales bacterium]